METKNLIIRTSNFDDCKYFAECEADPAVTEFFSINDGRGYEDVVRDFVRDDNDPTRLQMTIIKKSSDELIGRIWITRIDDTSNSMDVTRIYIADPKERNKGYGEEALRAVLEYGFVNMHMERITLDYFINNKPAAYLYDKIGFRNEGTLKHAAKKNGRYYDLQLRSMIRSEYFAGNHISSD